MPEAMTVLQDIIADEKDWSHLASVRAVLLHGCTNHRPTGSTLTICTSLAWNVCVSAGARHRGRRPGRSVLAPELWRLVVLNRLTRTDVRNRCPTDTR